MAIFQLFKFRSQYCVISLYTVRCKMLHRKIEINTFSRKTVFLRLQLKIHQNTVLVTYFMRIRKWIIISILDTNEKEQINFLFTTRILSSRTITLDFFVIPSLYTSIEISRKIVYYHYLKNDHFVHRCSRNEIYRKTFCFTQMLKSSLRLERNS